MEGVAQNYHSLLKEIDNIARQCGRDPEEITLVAVGKQHPTSSLLSAYDAGCRDFGENRVQEALEKIQEAPQDIHWHFIGHLQKNKVRSVVGKFALIHSIDSLELAKKISEISQELNLVTNVLLEANTSGEVSKHGLPPDEWKRLFPEIQSLPGIRVRGLMTMAPFIEDKEIIRQCFAKLSELRDQLEEDHDVELPELSMGMTHDYPIAIKEGATLLRIGTALFPAV